MNRITEGKDDAKDLIKKIGEIVRNLRSSKNLTQEELGKKINMSQHFISDIENGKTNISLIKLIQIFKGLDSDLLDNLNFIRIETKLLSHGLTPEEIHSKMIEIYKNLTPEEEDIILKFIAYYRLHGS